MPKSIIKGHTKPLYCIIIAKTSKQKLQSVNNHHLTKTETSRRRQFDLTIEGRQQSIEMPVICLLNIIIENAEYSICFYLHIKSLENL